MAVRLLSYIERDSAVHRLSGLTKLVAVLIFTTAAMITYDTRVLVGMLAFSVGVVAAARIRWKEMRGVVAFVSVFIGLNLLTVFLFSPLEGTLIYGSRHDIWHIAGRYTLTQEQLFYEATMMLKYYTILPSVLLFVLTTHPSEFAASLAGVGVNYRVCVALAIALRYIPDTQRDYHGISQAQQARGIDLSRKASIVKRLKAAANILLPMIFGSLQRIDAISSAMQLRGFGKHKKRTWYSERKMGPRDYGVLAAVTVLAAAALVITFQGGSRFWNPFAG